MKQYDCVIIGAGVAGMTSAIYCKRAGISVLLIEKGVPGGQINKTSTIENYPGFKQIDGPTLAMNMLDQVQSLEIPYQYGNVTSIEIQGEDKIIHTDMGDIQAKRIIVASGRKPRELGLPNEKALVGGGVSYCAYCDGMLYKDQDVAIIGGGNSALEEALYLANICKNVYLIHRREEYRADQILVDKIKKYSNIKPCLNQEVIEILEQDNKVCGVRLKDQSVLNVTGIFIYVGQIPETSFIENLLTLDQGYIVTNEHLETEIPGIYACGDVLKKELYQISTAIGEGALAGTNVVKSLK